MKTPKPKDWQERPQWKCDLALLMGKLVGWRNADFDTPLEDFITDLLKEAVEAERARLESLIPEKKEKTIHTPNCQRGTDKNNHFFCQFSREDKIWNEAISIMQEAVKRI